MNKLTRFLMPSLAKEVDELRAKIQLVEAEANQLYTYQLQTFINPINNKCNQLMEEITQIKTTIQKSGSLPKEKPTPYEYINPELPENAKLMTIQEIIDDPRIGLLLSEENIQNLRSLFRHEAKEAEKTFAERTLEREAYFKSLEPNVGQWPPTSGSAFPNITHLGSPHNADQGIKPLDAGRQSEFTEQDKTINKPSITIEEIHKYYKERLAELKPYTENGDAWVFILLATCIDYFMELIAGEDDKRLYSEFIENYFGAVNPVYLEFQYKNQQKTDLPDQMYYVFRCGIIHRFSITPDDRESKKAKKDGRSGSIVLGHRKNGDVHLSRYDKNGRDAVVFTAEDLFDDLEKVLTKIFEDASRDRKIADNILTNFSKRSPIMVITDINGTSVNEVI